MAGRPRVPPYRCCDRNVRSGAHWGNQRYAIGQIRDELAIRRIEITAQNPDDIVKSGKSPGNRFAIATHFRRSGSLNLGKPALTVAVDAQIGWRQKDSHSQLLRPPDHPGGMVEISRIELTERIALEGLLSIGIGRRMAGKPVFEKIDQNGVEAALPAILKIDFDVFPFQFGDQRPCRIALQQEGLARRILENASVLSDPDRKLASRMRRPCPIDSRIVAIRTAARRFIASRADKSALR